MDRALIHLKSNKFIGNIPPQICQLSSIKDFPFPISSFQKTCKSYPPKYLNGAESFHNKTQSAMIFNFQFRIVIVGARTRPLSDARNFQNREEIHRRKTFFIQAFLQAPYVQQDFKTAPSFPLFLCVSITADLSFLPLHNKNTHGFYFTQLISPLFELYRTQENLGLFQQFTEPRKV